MDTVTAQGRIFFAGAKKEARKSSVYLVETSQKVASELLQKCGQLAERASASSVTRSRELYDGYVKGHLDMAISRGLVLLADVKEKAGDLSAQTISACNVVFDALVAQFKANCSRQYESCQQPEETVEILLLGIALLLVILSRCVIWRGLSGVVRGVLYFSPLRLFLRMFSRTSLSPDSQALDESVETNASDSEEKRAKIEPTNEDSDKEDPSKGEGEKEKANVDPANDGDEGGKAKMDPPNNGEANIDEEPRLRNRKIERAETPNLG